MNETERNKVEHYLQHLDKEALKQAIMFLMFDNNGKQTILNMSNEWCRMYPLKFSDDIEGQEVHFR